MHINYKVLFFVIFMILSIHLVSAHSIDNDNSNYIIQYSANKTTIDNETTSNILIKDEENIKEEIKEGSNVFKRKY